MFQLNTILIHDSSWPRAFMLGKKKKKKGITQPYSMAQHKTSADILRRSCAVFL